MIDSLDVCIKALEYIENKKILDQKLAELKKLDVCDINEIKTLLEKQKTEKEKILGQLSEVVKKYKKHS